MHRASKEVNADAVFSRKVKVMINEVRHYHLFPGKFDDMVSRFETVNLPLFEKYGIAVEQIWSHIGDDALFSFIMSFKDEDSRKVAWEGYHADEAFIAGKEAQAAIIEHIDWYVLRPLKIGSKNA